MFHRTRRLVPAFVAGALGATGAIAHAAEPTQQQLLEQIQSLQQQVNELKVKQDQATTPPATSTTVDRVLSDADARSAPMLQASSTDFSAGYKSGKFIIQSADGLFSINPNFQLQVRHATNTRRNAGDSLNESGFELRRAKFGFAGNVFSKDLTYEFLWETARATGAVSLQDAWARYRFAPSWLIRVGQFKDPLGKEQTGSSKRLMAAERSLLNELLINGDDYVQGASLIYAPAEGPFRAEVAFTDGTGQSNTNFRDTNATAAQTLSPAVPATTVVINGVPTVTAPARAAVVIPGTADNRPEWGAAGRAELQLIGERFKGYDDFTAMNQAANMLVLGIGADVTQTGNQNLVTYTTDAQFENSHGLGLFGAIIGRYLTEFNAAGDSVNDLGFVLQASQMLGGTFAKAEWEAFGRISYTQLDPLRVSGAFEDTVPEYTIGLNGYFHGHASKVTLDYTYLPDGSPLNADSAAILQSDSSQSVVRLQYQLLI